MNLVFHNSFHLIQKDYYRENCCLFCVEMPDNPGFSQPVLMLLLSRVWLAQSRAVMRLHGFSVQMQLRHYQLGHPQVVLCGTRQPPSPQTTQTIKRNKARAWPHLSIVRSMRTSCVTEPFVLTEALAPSFLLQKCVIKGKAVWQQNSFIPDCWKGFLMLPQRGIIRCSPNEVNRNNDASFWTQMLRVERKYRF